jgi:hypothetical protein
MMAGASWRAFDCEVVSVANAKFGQPAAKHGISPCLPLSLGLSCEDGDALGLPHGCRTRITERHAERGVRTEIALGRRIRPHDAPERAIRHAESIRTLRFRKESHDGKAHVAIGEFYLM